MKKYGSWRSIRRKEAWNTTPTTAPATSPALRMRTETPLLTATTASDRHARSGIRKDTASTSAATKKAVRRCTSTATGTRSIPGYNMDGSLYDTADRQVSVAVFESTGGGDGAEGINRAEVSGGTRDVWKQRFVQLNRYDGENLRYETEESGKVIRFLFDRGELAEERREDAQIRYIRGYDPLLLIQDEEEQSRFSFVQDETGSTLFLLDEAHEIRKSYCYDTFGIILQETGDVPNRLTYTGQMYDGTAGQYYLRARFYNPVIGRFLQEDVYRGDGLNLYAYCANNPVMYYDPSGYARLCVNGKTSAQCEEYADVQYHKRIAATPKENSSLGRWTCESRIYTGGN